MNILGNPLDLLLIVVIALIVFGPAKLPEIMGNIGRAIADFRRATSQLSDEFNRTIQAELQETRALVDDTKSTVTGVHTSINSALTGTPAPTLTAEPNGTNGTGSTPSPATPPMADTMQWSWESAAPAPIAPAVQATEPVQETRKAPRKSARDELLPPY